MDFSILIESHYNPVGLDSKRAAGEGRLVAWLVGGEKAV